MSNWAKTSQATANLEDPKVRNAKLEQAEALKKEIERKTQDAQSRLPEKAARSD